MLVKTKPFDKNSKPKSLNNLLVKTKPTLQDKKRYVVYEVMSEAKINSYDLRREIEITYIKLFGEIDFIEANLRFFPNFSLQNKMIIQVARTSLEKLKVVFGWIKKINEKEVLLHCVLVSGTIKTCKQFLKNSV